MGASLVDLPLTVAVIEAVSSAANFDPIELPLLRNVIDPDALNTLFHPTSDGEFTFTYAGFTVTASASGTVDLAAER